MTGVKSVVVREGEEFFANSVEEKLVIAPWEVGPTHALMEEGVADER